MNPLNIYNTQDPLNSMMMNLNNVHNTIMELMMMILIIIMYMTTQIIINNKMNKELNKNNSIEITWTIMPMFVLVCMASPSLKLLYYMEDPMSPNISIKVIGNQWYWSYEYPEFNKFMESYMNNSNNKSIISLLEADNRLIIPINTNLRILATSNDVIHSWTVPSMAAKIDAVPGRLNQLMSYVSLPGLYFGQCSEICGMNHSFMPISIEVISINKFFNWVMSI